MRLETCRGLLPRTAEVVADRDTILPVMTNRLSNAVKYAPAGSGIGTRIDDNKDGENGDWVLEVSAEDRGQCISRPDMKKLLLSDFRRTSTYPQCPAFRNQTPLLYLWAILAGKGFRRSAAGDGNLVVPGDLFPLG